MDADIIVVFAGVNDYLSESDNKTFGDVNNKQSTAGYCGAVRSFMKQLDLYYGDRDIFFVTMYNIDETRECNYTDITTQPTLDDYIEVQRKLCAEYGFNIIELYDIGFMDCTDTETASYYLNDSVHPNDRGNIVLGEHIGAELSLYFSQN
jgi:lysophospholipase L1-like esterase